MDFILIPGFWLDGSSWDPIVPMLEGAGHRAHALTLPGMESRDADRRYQVPITVIACGFSEAMYREFMDPGHEWHPYVEELSRVGDVEFVDLPTGHWPQFTRPLDLGGAIMGALRPGDARPEPPGAGDETATLLGFLDHHRATLAWKCNGLEPAGLRATVGASEVTLGGLLKHMALVEDYWFSHRLLGRDPHPDWDAADWDDPDREWHSAAADSPAGRFGLWRSFDARSRSCVAEALAEGGMGFVARVPWPDGSTPSLRWILVHVIEEYSRHNGHADLIRESVDGTTGE